MLLTRKQTAIELNVSHRTVDRLIQKGHLKALKIGRSIRISQEQLEEYIKNSHFDPLKPGEVSVITEFSI